MKPLSLLLASLLLLGAVQAADEPLPEKQGWLGVYTEGLSEAMLAALGIEHGVLVAKVAPGSPAEQAGLAMGDVIQTLAGEQIDDPSDLRWTVRARPGEEVALSVRRKGKEVKLKARLESRDRVGWLDHFEFGGFPGSALLKARAALDKVGPEIERELRPYVSMDSLRAELEQLKAELRQLKEQLKQQTKGE